MVIIGIVISTILGIYGDLNNKKRLATISYSVSMGLCFYDIFF